MLSAKQGGGAMVWCEVWDDAGSVNAEFDFLPRAGEEIEVLADGKTSVRCIVKHVLHISPAAHHKDEQRPRIRLKVENADWP